MYLFTNALYIICMDDNNDCYCRLRYEIDNNICYCWLCCCCILILFSNCVVVGFVVSCFQLSWQVRKLSVCFCCWCWGLSLLFSGSVLSICFWKDWFWLFREICFWSSQVFSDLLLLSVPRYSLGFCSCRFSSVFLVWHLDLVLFFNSFSFWLGLFLGFFYLVPIGPAWRTELSI